VLRRSFSSFLLATGATLALGACSSANSNKSVAEPVKARSSAKRLYTKVPTQKVDIEVGAERSGHSLVVQVHGIGRGHASGQELENPKAWQISASYGESPLRQVLAGPARVSRQPTGAAMGNQWDIEVQFMVAFALPDRAGKVAVRVQAPTGEVAKREISVEAPAEKLSLR
jgi:hypothetical protein